MNEDEPSAAHCQTAVGMIASLPWLDPFLTQHRCTLVNVCGAPYFAPHTGDIQ
jgi:hypothetical protein